MVNLYKFQEHSLIVIGEKYHLLEMAENLRESECEGTISDLVYQIEYAFDVDGVRRDSESEYDKRYEENFLIELTR